MPTEPTTGVEEKTRDLQFTTGAAFDQDYLNRMIRDHLATLGMFRQVAKFGATSDIRQYAESQIPILEKHLKEARRVEASLTGTSASIAAP